MFIFDMFKAVACSVTKRRSRGALFRLWIRESSNMEALIILTCLSVKSFFCRGYQFIEQISLHFRPPTYFARQEGLDLKLSGLLAGVTNQ